MSQIQPNRILWLRSAVRFHSLQAQTLSPDFTPSHTFQQMRGFNVITGQAPRAGFGGSGGMGAQHNQAHQQNHHQRRLEAGATGAQHQQQKQQQQQQQDEQIAKMLQAQEMHRAMHPSRLGGQGGHGGHGHGALRPHLAGVAGHRQHAGVSGGLPGREPVREREARHRLRDKQLEMALEVNPEAFVSVPMLYVQCELNNVPIKAFVDTGAQMTVMNTKCAQRTGLLAAIDSRFKGVAAGVGMARIVGRVHMATLRFSRKTAVDTSITVLEQSGGPELLLGLDLMRKYQATIDLGRNALILGGEALPFVTGDRERQ